MVGDVDTLFLDVEDTETMVESVSGSAISVDGTLGGMSIIAALNIFYIICLMIGVITLCFMMRSSR